MFKENKYTLVYYRIINRAKNRILVGYGENHHTIPTCIGGANIKDNIVRLTAREHFICHHLLTKMHDFRGLQYAFILMLVNNPFQERNFIVTSKVYEITKRMNASLATIKFTGKQKHNVGKKKWHDPITQIEYLVFPGDENSSWVCGSSTLTKSRMKGKHVGKVYYHNKSTNEVIHLLSHIEPPFGFVKGNPNSDTGYSCVGKKNFYNPVTGDSIKSFECPEGFVVGAVKTWATNGVENIMVNRVTHIFDENWLGWRIGRTFNAHKGKND